MISNHADLLFKDSLPHFAQTFYMYSPLFLPFSAHVFFCQEIHLQISFSDPIPLDPPRCLSPSPSPLFSLSPSLESHMVSLKWSTIKRGAQGAHCPHLFSCSAWAVPSLVKTVSCDILCLPEVKLPGAFMQHVPKLSVYVLYRTADYLALNGGYCIFWGVCGR